MATDIQESTTAREKRFKCKRNRFLTLIRKHPGISRVKCAEIMNLSTFNISRLAQQLLEEGMIQEECARVTDDGSPLQGRPPLNLYLKRDYKYFAGIDFEATAWRFCIVDFRGDEIYRSQHAFHEQPDAAGYEKILHSLLQEEIKQSAGLFDKVSALGIAAPGIIDPEAGVVKEYAALPNFSNIAIGEICQSVSDRPVFLLNNTSSIAVYDLWKHPDCTEKVIYHVAVRSGIGSALLTHGRLLTGANNHPGELGCFPIPVKGTHKQFMPLQDVAGLLALRHALPDVPKGFWQGNVKAVEEVFQDSAKRPVLQNALHNLAHALVGISAVTDPDEIVIHSPIFRYENILWKHLCHHFKRCATTLPGNPINLRLSDTTSTALAWGAALHATGMMYPTIAGNIVWHHRRQALMHVQYPTLM